MNASDKQRKKNRFNVQGVFFTVYTVLGGVLIFQLMGNEGLLPKEESVLELRTDMLHLNRQFETMTDKEALQAVLDMEKRLEWEEGKTATENSLQVERWLTESHDILLSLHDDLQERDIEKKDYPKGQTIY